MKIRRKIEINIQSEIISIDYKHFNLNCLNLILTGNHYSFINYIWLNICSYHC